MIRELRARGIWYRGNCDYVEWQCRFEGPTCHLLLSFFVFFLCFSIKTVKNKFQELFWVEKTFGAKCLNHKALLVIQAANPSKIHLNVQPLTLEPPQTGGHVQDPEEFP